MTQVRDVSLPLLSNNDEQRLMALQAFNILDTHPEPSFDGLAQLAAQICKTPIALVSFVDTQRLFFKAVVGLQCVEVPRKGSFCDCAISALDDMLVVSDALEDRRFAELALVTGPPHIRFFCGARLVTSDGWALGTLCVIDTQPRVLKKGQLDALQILRQHVMTALELRLLVTQQERTIKELERTRRALEDARHAAEEATRIQAEFFATMSHEIRTPMNAVIGMSALVRDTPLSGEQLEYVETIQTSGDHLLCVINDILDFSKIEANKLEIEKAPFSLIECVAASLRLLSVRATEKKLKVTSEIAPGTPDRIHGDVTRLRQILVNLLSNAVKFTEIGEVRVTVCGAPMDDYYKLTFGVSDTGIGIPQDRICRLFQRFSQVDASTTRQYGGTGLGLVISQRLAELQGGNVWVESKSGCGSTFYFTIKVQVDQKPTPISKLSPRSGHFDPTFAKTYPCRILVVEDNPTNRKVIGRMLERLGYAPDFAFNGLLALTFFQTSTYDLVLMDAEMPEMDGPTASKRIREDFPEESQPVIVALTAHAGASFREALLLSGMNEMLTKPLRLPELIELLKGFRHLRKPGT